MNRPGFTLVEVVIVLGMLGMLMTLAVGRLVSFPSAAGMEKTVREIERFFAMNSHAASISGNPETMSYDPEKRQFSLSQPGTDDNTRYLQESFRQVTIHQDIQVSFPGLLDDPDRKIIFSCYPDGTASGPDLELKLNQLRLKFSISPLTGQLVRWDNGNHGK